MSNACRLPAAVALVLVVSAMAGTGCGSSEQRTNHNLTVGWTLPDGQRLPSVRLAVPATVADRARFRSGAQVAVDQGCLSCHQIEDNGNDGPGPELTDIGARLTRTRLAHTLRMPISPMPSFADLPAGQFGALVYFLTQLH